MPCGCGFIFWGFAGSEEKEITKMDEECVEAALENELILSNIFKFLNVRDLKNARMVSKLWNKNSKRDIQEKSVVKLELPRDGKSDTFETMKKFLKDFATIPSQEVWFRNYRIMELNLDEIPVGTMLTFWQKFGHSIESLDLIFVRMVGVKMVRDVFFKNTPNLRRMVIKDCNFYEEKITYQPFFEHLQLDANVPVNSQFKSLEFYAEDVPNHFPVGWEEIFTAFPNMKNIKFYNLTPYVTRRILKAALSFKKTDPQNMMWEELNIFNGDYAAKRIPKKVMQQLLSLKFPLKELSIDIGKYFDEIIIAELLKQQRNLKKLVLYKGLLDDPMINFLFPMPEDNELTSVPLVNFPFQITFFNLTHLEVTQSVVETMNFVKFMPNLVSLALCEPPDVVPSYDGEPCQVIQKTDLNFAESGLPKNLVNLTIDYNISRGDVRKLVHWFPTIKCAKIYLDNESFRLVCGNWPKLEELQVFGDKLTSEGVTGIEFNIIQHSTLTYKSYDFMNILRLTNLRKFVMKIRCPKLVIKLDDLSVDEGFLKMKSLNYLQLCSKHITENGWRKLFEAENIKTLIPSDNRWPLPSDCEKFQKPYPSI